MKFLVVDDSESMRKIMIRMLGSLGYTDVVQAADGVEALEATDANSFKLILLDWNMPRMDGLTMARKLRSTGDKTPIVMVTTEVEKSKILQAAQAGVNNYMIKPFQPDVLKRIITATVEGKAA